MMHIFNKTNLPVTLVVILLTWAWISLISVLVGALF
jgi:hypothetical protein